MLTVHQIINEPVPSNCYVLYDKEVGRECVVVDPGSKSNGSLFSFFQKEGIYPIYVILTHEHFDHCWGVNELQDRFSIPIVCSAICRDYISLEKRNCSVFYDYNERFVITGKSVTVESLNGVLPFAGAEFHFLFTPGHSIASVCLLFQKCLFTGDTLIKDLRTVTKLPTGSVEKLKESLNAIEKLRGMDITVYPGHGESFSLDGYSLDKAL